jgi:hypothetical protein
VVPELPGLRFQVLHSADAGEAYRRAVTREVRGAFNLAADPVIDATQLAELLGASLQQHEPAGPDADPPACTNRAGLSRPGPRCASLGCPHLHSLRCLQFRPLGVLSGALLQKFRA